MDGEENVVFVVDDDAVDAVDAQCRPRSKEEEVMVVALKDFWDAVISSVSLSKKRKKGARDHQHWSRKGRQLQLQSRILAEDAVVSEWCVHL